MASGAVAKAAVRGAPRPGIAHTQFYGIQVIIDGQSDGAIMPDWWQSSHAGFCRENSAILNACVAAVAAPCSKLWATIPAGAILWQTTAYPQPPGNVPSPHRVRCVLVLMLPTARVALNVSREYNAFQLTLDTDNTVDDPDNGVSICTGCATPLTLVLQQLTVWDEANGGSFEASTDPLVNRCITWQSSTVDCRWVVPTHNQTWGQLKSLYR
jgi:hypothetical protein